MHALERKRMSNVLTCKQKRREGLVGKGVKKGKTYNSGDSLVVTDPTTNPPVSGLTMGERTGSRIFHYLWSYVLDMMMVLLMTTSSCMFYALKRPGRLPMFLAYEQVMLLD